MEERNFFKKLIKIFSSKIARRFAFRLITLSLVVALFLSLFVLYRNYKQDIQLLQRDLAQIERSIKSSLSYNLWIMNLDALKILVNDLSLNKYIAYVALYDEDDRLLIEQGHKLKEHTITKEIPLYFKKDKNLPVYLGKLVYIVDTGPIYKKFIHSAFKIVVLILLFFLFMSIVVIVIYWDTTVRYLLHIQEYAEKLRLGGYKEKELPKLQITTHSKKKDEFGHLVETINEMRQEILQNYKKLEYQSLHDALTNLPNRRWIKKRLEELIAQKRRPYYSVIFYLDLDQFKLINDSLGHSAGDRILLEVAARLKELCAKMCTAARISGDEFLIVCNKRFSNKEEAKKAAFEFAQKILQKISEPIQIEHNFIKITGSIGIAIISPESDAEIVVKQADNALYHAKEKGRSQVAIFEPNMQKVTDRRLEIEQLIDIAMQKDLFFMQYQPKVDAAGTIKSAESLLRLKDEQGNVVSPGEFIPIAEESGLIVKLGDIVLQKVFSFVQKNYLVLKNAGMDSLAINVSPTQYSSAGFAQRVIEFARYYKIDPKFIILEITEEVVAGSRDLVMDVMRQLKKEGFRFSIDDFGTGYSSLQYIKDFPLDELKIDKSFIDTLLLDEKSMAIVKTIIDMAHNLNLYVTAEGVETEEQFKVLYKYGCDLYQGFLFYKPLEEKEFIVVLNEKLKAP